VNTYLLKVAIGVLTLGASLAGQAQPRSAGDDRPVEELIITGAREPIARADLGSAVSVLSAEQILARQVPVLSQILRDLPGLAVSRTGPIGSQTQVRIRGAEGNQTLVLIDGIEATDPVSSFEMDFGTLLTTGVERVEVIRGPQSALYGSEAIGGVINIITRRPKSGFEVEALGEGGSFGTARFGATVSGGTDRYGGTVSVGYLDTDGVSASPTDPEDDGYENLTLSGKAVAQPLDSLELGVIGRYVGADSEFDNQDFTTGLVVDADRQREFSAFYGRAYANLELFDGAWLHRFSAELTDTESDTFTDGTFDNSFQGQRKKLEYQSTVEAYGQALTAALEHEDLDFKAVGAVPTDPINQSRDDDQTSIIGELRLAPFESLFLTVGVRHDANDIFADETTWRAAAAYELTETTRLHASYGTGVSDPTFFDRFGFFPDQFVGNPALTPEQAEGWDAGVAQRFWDGRVELDATFFYATLEDEIVSAFDPVTFLSTVENQAGESERKGVELTLHAEPLDGLSLDGAYTYLDAEEPDGSKEIRRAEHIASLTATYRLPEDRADISLDFDYNGKQDDLDFSTFPATRVTLDEFLLVTLAARYRLFSGVEAFARIENLLDEDYRNVFGFNTPGIGAFAGLRVRY